MCHEIPKIPPMKSERIIPELSQLTPAAASLQSELWMGKWKIVQGRSASSAAAQVFSLQTYIIKCNTPKWNSKKHKMNEMDLRLGVIYILGAQKAPRNCAGNIETILFVYSPCTAMGLQHWFKTPFLKRYVVLSLGHKNNNCSLKCLKSYISRGEKISAESLHVMVIYNILLSYSQLQCSLGTDIKPEKHCFVLFN